MNNIENLALKELIQKYPFVSEYFQSNKLDIGSEETRSFSEFLDSFSEETIEDLAIDKDSLTENLKEYIKNMREFLGIKDVKSVESLTILPGFDKSKNKEGFDTLTLHKSEIIAIVGPTGSGKSRLLADIEWTAQNDTPTGRSILIDERVPDMKWRFSSNNKLVAQLSQNMNFVMDLSVREFLELHAGSRLVEDIQGVTKRIIEEANKLAGEKFQLETPITSLSGGQSRALMIADTAILSSSPIVLIDEIENAGIDRRKALDLLIGEEKIVLMATHDPTLALIGDRRIVIKNGGIQKIIKTSVKEKELLKELEKMDNIIQAIRSDLRSGKELHLEK